MRQLERIAAEQASACTLVSDAEAELCRQHCPGDAIHVVPNGVDLDSFRPTPSADEQSCAFVGALDYRPNVDAALWFCDRVWPRVRKRLRFGDAVHRRAAPRPVRQEPVAPSRRHRRRRRTRRAALPRPRGRGRHAASHRRGIQNKVLEAMAMGKAVVASPQSLTGLDVEPDTHVLCASAEAEWVEAVGRTFDDGRLRRASASRPGGTWRNTTIGTAASSRSIRSSASGPPIFREYAVRLSAEVLTPPDDATGLRTVDAPASPSNYP